MSDVTFFDWPPSPLSHLVTFLANSPRWVPYFLHGPIGGWGQSKSDVTHSKNFVCSFSFFVLRKSVKYITSLNFCVTTPVFDENKEKYRTKSSRWKDYFLLIFKIKGCHFLVSDMGGEGVEAKYDKVWQGGGGRKIAILGVTYFLNCPIHIVIVLKEFVLKQKMKNLLKSIFVSVDVHFFGDHVTMQNR